MFNPSAIVDLQNQQDQRLHHTILEQTDKITKVHSDISQLNMAISSLRRKSKNGSDSIDMSEAEESLRQAYKIFEELKRSHPNFISENEALFDLENIDFKKMKIEELEAAMDKIANAITIRQNEIPEITQMLKLATDLNEIISKIIQEMSKEYRKSGSNITANIGRA